MRSVPRRERHRRLRNAKDCACRYHSPTPQIFDRLELLDQQLNYALPVGIISQAIITTDNYLGYSLSHYLFSGKRTAAFRSLDDISLWIEKGSLRQLIVDMEALPVSVLRRLTSYACSVGNKAISRFTCWYQIKPRYSSVYPYGWAFFCPVATTKSGLSTRSLVISLQTSLIGSFSRTDWLMIETLAQGASLKEIARQQSVPYHRVVYRIKQLITLLNLPTGKAFFGWSAANVTSHDIF
ncbi:fimbriae Y protein [Salmonella enterica subsp. enterica]|uniref:Fimbriae Y protein n=1 Tax=Salmonella enterica I TaxID=59201 RepID=A0A379WYY3_SALET|nr:fimbriae Y protein [Salmonella enterica subsp. enterica]